jgi:uncharacterized protein YdaU (DUF1376 family)
MSKKTDLWMPLYVGDYLADTGHLTTTQHGAYLLLMMHYWRKRELPADDKQLAAIAKLPLRIWLDSKETLQAFFYDGWNHKRIDAELEKRTAISEKRAAAGYNGGMRTQINHMMREANAPVCLSKTQSPRNNASPARGERGKGLANGLTVSPELAAALAKK